MRGFPGAFGVSLVVHVIPLSAWIGWGGLEGGHGPGEGGGMAVTWSPVPSGLPASLVRSEAGSAVLFLRGDEGDAGTREGETEAVPPEPGELPAPEAMARWGASAFPVAPHSVREPLAAGLADRGGRGSLQVRASSVPGSPEASFGPGILPSGPCPPPPYPEEARRRGVEGVLEMEVVVDAGGRLASARLLSSSGSALLDRVTLEWVRRRWGPFAAPAGSCTFRCPVRFVLAPR